jgi:pimeloyl-ACP methyl ester carboxylesterase
MAVPRYEVIDGLRIRYVRSAESSNVPVLMTTPWRESIFAFHAIWPKLVEQWSLVAIDLPGFGQSQSRPDVLEPRVMGAFLRKAIDKLGLERPHIVAPDVGTSAALYAAVDTSKLITSITVGAGAIGERLVANTLKTILDSPDTSAFDGIDGAHIVTRSIPKLMQMQPTKIVMDDYRASYAANRFVESMAYVRSYPTSLPTLRGLLQEIELPVAVLFGRNDPIVLPADAEILERELRHRKLVSFECGTSCGKIVHRNTPRLCTIGWQAVTARYGRCLAPRLVTSLWIREEDIHDDV